MSLRVLHVITRLTLGGSAENTVGSMLGLAAAGYDTSLAVGLAESDAASIGDARRRGVALVDVPRLGREVGPRDGFQNEPDLIATDDKVRLIEALAGAGYQRMEVASFVRPDVIPQLADGVEVLRRIRIPDYVRLSVLIPNERGLDNALAERELFDDIGLVVSAQQAFAMLKSGGTATVIGMLPLGEKLEIDGISLLLEKKLQGSNMGSNRFRVDMPQYVDWYLAGKLKLDELVSATMPIEQINDGFERLGSGEVARQLITFDHH